MVTITTGYQFGKKINLNHCFKTYIKIITKQNKNFNLTLHTKSNTKWITELSVKPNYKISIKNKKKSLHRMLGKDFIDTRLKA